MTARYQAMKHWLDSLGYRNYSLNPASEDASFRSYYRLHSNAQSWIVMDAPPQQEPCEQFVMIAQKLRNAGLSAPAVVAKNFKQGFLLLSDFGSTDYRSVLNAKTEASLYADALSALLQMQRCMNADNLPHYDEALLNHEMDLFHDWFLQRLLYIKLNQSQLRCWQSIKQVLIANALEQPQVFVHRDYHSRNLMKINTQNPGILDFQDAVKGPVTYDLVSLLRDCYLNWPPSLVRQHLQHYYNAALEQALINTEYHQFLHWFNLMGIQRHLKAIGIFSRLNIRDTKPGYLPDIPRTLTYISEISREEKSTTALYTLLNALNLKDRVNVLL